MKDGDNIVLMALLALIWVHLVLNTPTLADFEQLKTEVMNNVVSCNP